MVKLGEEFDLQMGKTPDRKNDTYWNTGDNLWVSIADMSNCSSKYIVSTKETISDDATINMKQVPKGIVIMSFKLSIGKVSITDANLYTNEAIMAFLPRNDYYADFLYYRLLSFAWTEGLNKAVKGITLNKASISNTKMLFPSFEQQKRIVATLDKASELIALHKKQLEELDALAESVFYDMFGDPVKNEKGWKTETISALVKKKPNSLKRGPFGGALKKEIFVSDGCLVYEQYHALNNDYSFARYFITEDKFEGLKNFSVESDDIIISCSGVNLGRLSVIPKNAKKGIINQALLKLSLNQDKMINSVFVRIFENESFKNKYFGNQRGCAIPNFPPMSDFKKFEFPTPPIALQTRFATIIEKIEQQKILARKALQESEDLFQRLMQDLFKPD